MRKTLLERLARGAAALPAGLLLAAAAGCGAEVPAQESPATAAAEAAGPAVPLLDGLGDHGQPVTTRSPLAQRYFDQGMRLYYAFNHAEAVRAFGEAARLDPACAMCYWGAALAHGPNINAPMDSAAGVKAYGAVREAVRVAEGGASPRERALIGALALRYAAVPPADRAALDSAYARAMGEVARRFPDDAEAATLHAESLMDLSPWNYWERDGTPRPGTRELVARLEGVIARRPSHPGACHFYIHAVEAVHPEKAVACAERLAGLMPAAGHLVHMPGHIYIRVGRYADAIAANEHAVHADETYIRDQRPETGIYTAGYYPHNYHFLAFAASMAGRGEQAIAAARAVVKHVTPEVAVLSPDLQQMPAYLHLALTSFGRWDEVLRTPMPPGDLRVATALAAHARGVALAAKGREKEAAEALALVRRLAADEPEGPSQPVLRIAAHVTAGEIAAWAGRRDEAVAELRRAAAIEDGMTYFEPPLWYYPVRHSLGKALLEAGRPAEAEAAYREDLERFPENGWSLFGLAAALRAQGKGAAAAEVDARFRRAWQGADAKLTASRF